jgi:hypothetical protein
MGGDGTAITLVSFGELSDFNNIKALTKTTIEEISSQTDSESAVVGFY